MTEAKGFLTVNTKLCVSPKDKAMLMFEEKEGSINTFIGPAYT